MIDFVYVKVLENNKLWVNKHVKYIFVFLLAGVKVHCTEFVSSLACVKDFWIGH